MHREDAARRRTSVKQKQLGIEIVQNRNLLAHSSIHSFTHSLITHSLMHSFIPSFFPHALIHPYIHSCSPSFIRSFAQSFVQPTMCPVIHRITFACMKSVTHQVTDSLLQSCMHLSSHSSIFVVFVSLVQSDTQLASFMHACDSVTTEFIQAVMHSKLERFSYYRSWMSCITNFS